MNGKLKCAVSITRLGSGPDRTILIEFTDKLSGNIAARVEMKPEEFADCVTGRGHCAGEMEFNDSGCIGMQYESKVVEIEIPKTLKYQSNDLKVKKALIAKMEIWEDDGWQGRESDLFNHHNYTSKGINVVFTRYVKANPE